MGRSEGGTSWAVCGRPEAWARAGGAGTLFHHAGLTPRWRDNEMLCAMRHTSCLHGSMAWRRKESSVSQAGGHALARR